MKLYNHLDEYSGGKNPVVTIGTFDGLHLGHRKIIARLADAAKEMEGESVLLSFFPHPRFILNPENHNLKLLNTLDEKINLLSSTKLDHIILHPFDRAFSNIKSEEFVEGILVGKLKAKKVIIGYDHHFGKGRKGSFAMLQEESKRFHFELEEIPAQDVQHIHISSTKIREALLAGDIRLANEFLGYNYLMRGTVVAGDRIGRSIHFPTANIFVEEKYKLIPRNGVYAVEVFVKGRCKSGMLNIGNRPTIPGRNFSIEVHILDFNEDIYGETIQIDLIERIRDEIRFNDLDSLREQLKLDKESVKSIMK